MARMKVLQDRLDSIERDYEEGEIDTSEYESSINSTQNKFDELHELYVIELMKQIQEEKEAE
jgi:hypothetical protein